MTAPWSSKSLGELFRVGSSRRVLQSQWQSEGVPFYRGREITLLAVEGFVNNALFISEDLYAEFSAKNGVPSAGDIMITAIGTIGNSYIVQDSDRFYFKDASVLWLKKTTDVSSDFINWWLKSPLFFEQLDRGNGATVDTLTIQKLQTVAVNLPPLPEQQRIVTLLDEAFDGIATARAHAEKNLQNARAIFESHLQSVFTQRGDGWKDKTLDQVCIVERGSSPRPIKEFFTTAADGLNWIKIGDTEEGGKYVYATAQKITPDGAKHSRFVREGDFILTNSMSYGRPYIMKTSGYIHDGWFVLRLNLAIDTDYFYYLLSSSFVQSQFAQLASGSVVKNISGDLVKRVVLPIPPLDQQQVVVAKLLELSSETHRLESLYQRKIVALDELKKSLLAEAFSGAL